MIPQLLTDQRKQGKRRLAASFAAHTPLNKGKGELASSLFFDLLTGSTKKARDFGLLLVRLLTSPRKENKKALLLVAPTRERIKGNCSFVLVLWWLAAQEQKGSSLLAFFFSS